ncbi:hypothetical protein CHF27_006575 [Romboutsia maritimum]|uniref:Membrane-associated protein n=1 Tax=Romboutsia maritimum TaxID=2020948 RepID=A0A371ITH7_9FIRM|nr:hypothetical protein [Romboutsia maritimum]RDY23781.1 hypothetical protein CHF27_006575 [Romboutsia maritimum]
MNFKSNNLSSKHNLVKYNNKLNFINEHNIKNLFIILLILILLICIFSLSKIMLFSKNPKNIVNSFEKCIENSNVLALKNLLYCNDNSLELNEKTLTKFLDYLNENPSYKIHIIDHLRHQSSLKNDTNEEKELFNLKKSNNNNYKIFVKPVYCTIHTPIRDTNITVDDNTLVTSNSNDFNRILGPLFPGKYKFTAIYKNNFTSVQDNLDFDFISSYKNSSDFNIKLLQDIQNNMVLVHGDFPEAKIYVNGKCADILLEDSTYIGPVEVNSKIYASININGIELKSNVCTYDGYSKDIYLKFDDYILSSPTFTNEEDIKNQITSLVKDYLNNLPNAINNNDFSYISKYLKINSNIYNEKLNFINELNEKKMTYYIKDINISKIELDNSKLNFVVKASETCSITDTEGNTINKTYNIKYFGSYDKTKSELLLTDLSLY